MTRSVLVVALLMTATITFSQKIQLINSGEVLEKGKALYDSGKYEDAIKAYNTVPARDTNYVYMLYETALAYVSDKRPEKALEICELALQKPGKFRADFLRLQAVATDNKGDVEKSIELFKKASEKYPGSYSLLYNLGITYYNSKDYEKATETFFKVLHLNPYHSGSHLNLGRIALGQGRKTHAMMSLGIYLSISNSDNQRLVTLNNFLDNALPDEGTLPMFGNNAAEKLDQIIKAKIAMDKNFKSTIPVDAPVVKQYEMFFQQLGTINESIDDEWIKYYGGLYKKLKEQQLADAFIYYIISSSGKEPVKKWLSKNDKVLQMFFDNTNKLLKQRVERIDPAIYGFVQFGFTKPIAAWYDDSHYLDALGEKVNDKRQGKWVFFHDNQELSGEGEFNDKGEKIGTWKFYDSDGLMSSIENATTGEVTLYYPNGAKREHYFTKDQLADGDVELFYPCGALKEKIAYKAGVREGKGQTYYPSGKIKSTYEHRQNQRQGEFTYYYDNGQIMSKSNYLDDKLSGKYISYFANGKIEDEGAYLNDQASGIWKTYYINGRLHRTGMYQNGVGTGEWLYYDRDGKLDEKRSFDTNGRYQNENPIYHNEVLTAIYTYKKDVIVKLTEYDPQGKVRFTGGNNDGTFPVKTYFSSGELRSEGNYKKGQQDGQWKFYFRNGKVNQDYNYKDGLLQGVTTLYYESGDKKSIANYDHNELHGYYQEFFQSGELKQEGWYQFGKKEQQWLSYYLNGKIENDIYYLSDEPYDRSFNYSRDGKIFSESEYDRNGFIARKYFNKNNEIRISEKLTDTLENIVTKFSNKKTDVDYGVVCGEYHGKFNRWYPDGSLFFSYPLENGKKNGKYIVNFINGAKSLEGNFLNDEYDGFWRMYYDNGQVSWEGKYLGPGQDSIWNFYSPDGKISASIPFRNGDRNGVATYYTPEGSLLLQKLYDNDDIISYRTANADGSWSEWKKFSGTEKIIAKYPNGNVAIEETFVNGLRDGARTTWFSNGKICEEHHYSKGLYEGTHVLYYANGNLKEKGFYVHDELNGKFESFDEQGHLLRSEMYDDGVRNGKATAFSKGVKVSEINFENDIVVE